MHIVWVPFNKPLNAENGHTWNACCDEYLMHSRICYPNVRSAGIENKHKIWEVIQLITYILRYYKPISFLTWPFEHIQHSLCHKETTANVDARYERCSGGQGLHCIGRIVPTTHQQHATHSCYTWHGICYWHEWRVQCGRHAPNCVISCITQNADKIEH